jgi:hypothetical protein
MDKYTFSSNELQSNINNVSTQIYDIFKLYFKPDYIVFIIIVIIILIILCSNKNEFFINEKMIKWENNFTCKNIGFSSPDANNNILLTANCMNCKLNNDGECLVDDANNSIIDTKTSVLSITLTSDINSSTDPKINTCYPNDFGAYYLSNDGKGKLSCNTLAYTTEKLGCYAGCDNNCDNCKQNYELDNPNHQFGIDACLAGLTNKSNNAVVNNSNKANSSKSTSNMPKSNMPTSNMPTSNMPKSNMPTSNMPKSNMPTILGINNHVNDNNSNKTLYLFFYNNIYIILGLISFMILLKFLFIEDKSLKK